jgi:Kef-type K+ transport system membrane component KefB
MQADVVPLVVGLIIFFSSIFSLRLRLSVAIIEITLGAIAGYFGLRSQDWMVFLATFGGILLTFLAGTEIDTQLMRRRFKESFLIGFFSFLVPFIFVFLVSHLLLHWQFKSSLIAGIALSTTSLAVVYSVLIEMGLSKTEIGRLLMAATFVTDMGVALTMSLLFLKPTVYTALFVLVSILVIFLATRFSEKIFKNPKLKNKVIEPEIKYIFILLLTFIYFAKLGESHAVLPAFLLGFFMSRHFHASSGERMVINRLRTVSYAIITPIFFIVGGMRISVPLIVSGIAIFAVFFVVKLIAKFIGVYFLAKKYIPSGSMYTTLLMSTGLTFGTIASVFGLQSGIIDQSQYSILVGVVIASAVIPTFIAQKWFAPIEEEDMLDNP